MPHVSDWRNMKVEFARHRISKIFNLLGYEIEFLSVYYFLSLIKNYSWFMVFNEWFPVMFLNEKMGSSVSVFNNEENWW